jgi:acetylornithine deacetylase/succinyl-diaminopimelate desuccinylase-like protein
MKIELFNYSNDLVAKHEMPYFTKLPEVITWGYRTFVKTDNFRYKEAFVGRIPEESYVPVDMRVGDPAELIENLAKIAWDIRQAHFVAEEERAVEPLTWDMAQGHQKSAYRKMAEAVMDEGIKAFSATWIVDEDGTKYLRYNRAATRI